MQKLNYLVVVFSVLFIGFGCQSQNSGTMDYSTVKELDVERYLGTWYEIARYDHRFERDLVGVTATYSKRDDGEIEVVNRGYKNSLNGELSEAVGKAKLTDEPGKLKVSFFWIFYADYNVLELDENYQWALIGSSNDKYLWILSRTTQLDEHVLIGILKKAEQRGYSASKLIWVKQKEQ
ncbi:lipocalin family protein [Maribellus maritimus]|uniref:lipocalin family protein n=1 Tax=Maribellus maritimus TaxID=2870838 RepID=UPI001EEC81F5|nr:lipocalin family protein [Maribellus maritimus]MCG6188540.1 lipocalin family protein [Maribellus maritimus]